MTNTYVMSLICIATYYFVLINNFKTTINENNDYLLSTKHLLVVQLEDTTIKHMYLHIHRYTYVQ